MHYWWWTQSTFVYRIFFIFYQDIAIIKVYCFKLKTYQRDAIRISSKLAARRKNLLHGFDYNVAALKCGALALWAYSRAARRTCFRMCNDMQFHPCSQFYYMVHVKVRKLPLVSFFCYIALCLKIFVEMHNKLIHLSRNAMNEVTNKKKKQTFPLKTLIGTTFPSRSLTVIEWKSVHSITLPPKQNIKIILKCHSAIFEWTIWMICVKGDW